LQLRSDELSKCPRCSVLDDGLVSINLYNSRSGYNLLPTGDFSLNSKRFKSAEFHNASRNVITIIQVPSGSLLREKEHQADMKSLSKRNDTIFRDIHYATHILNPKLNEEGLTRDERIHKVEFNDKIATKKFGTEHSAEMIIELTEYRSKEGFFGRAFVLKSAYVPDAAV
jgi:hypothetical protein